MRHVLENHRFFVHRECPKGISKDEKAVRFSASA